MSADLPKLIAAGAHWAKGAVRHVAEDQSLINENQLGPWFHNGHEENCWLGLPSPGATRSAQVNTGLQTQGQELRPQTPKES